MNVYHIETREKNPTLLKTKNWEYTLKTLAQDLFEVIKAYDLNSEDIYIMGDSVGAEVVLEALELYKKAFKPPKGLILVAPTKTFSFSKWMHILFRFAPSWLFYPLFPFLRFVLKRFRTDMKNDPGSFYLNIRSLNSLPPKILKKCAIELMSYHSDVDYSNITCPTYIFAASTDRMHSFKQSEEIAQEIPKAKFEDVIHFAKTHKAYTAKKIIEFVDNLEKEKEM